MDIESIRKADEATASAFELMAPTAYGRWIDAKGETDRMSGTGDAVAIGVCRKAEVDAFVKLVKLIVTCGFPVLKGQ